MALALLVAVTRYVARAPSKVGSSGQPANTSTVLSSRTTTVRCTMLGMFSLLCTGVLSPQGGLGVSTGSVGVLVWCLYVGC